MSAAKAVLQLDYSRRSSFFKTLSGHYDALCQHFPEKLILTPQFPKPKKFKGYLHQHKVLLRLEAPHLPRSRKGTVRHDVYCTWCHAEPESEFKPGKGHWKMDAGHTTSSFLNKHVKNRHPGVPWNEAEEKRELEGVPETENPNKQYQGLGKRSAHEAGLVVEKVPSWKYRKAGSKISLRKFRRLLLEFFISANITTSVVENPQFHELLEYLDSSGGSVEWLRAKVMFGNHVARRTAVT
ncbi:hypothetical protein FN846DRAFT_909323 [Sphaerosporella brunnea]|uniref:Uncharacterized protein n=1 Tax=Sphaerosporella brunnea TaxID=1250544 RepID=A0A5J5EQW9_9PEZI|nr:hypothetical protein FN846DRAFT_909323 [Sphaerosporella brunnea]